MFCSNCGSKQGSEVKFCTECGKAIGAADVETGEVPATAKKAIKLSKKQLLIAGSAVVVLVVGAIALMPHKSGPDFLSALKKCNLTTSSDGVTYSADENTLSLDGQGDDEYSGMDIFDEECVVDSLKVSTVVNNRMDHTTSLMGMQSGDWLNIHADWSYSSGNGWDVTLSPKQ